MHPKILTAALLALSLSACAPSSYEDRQAFRNALIFGATQQAFRNPYQYRQPTTCYPLSSNIGGPVYSISCY